MKTPHLAGEARVSLAAPVTRAQFPRAVGPCEPAAIPENDIGIAPSGAHPDRAPQSSMAAVAGASLAAAEILLTQVLHRVPPAKPLVLHILSLDRTVGQPVTRAFCTKAAEQVGNVLLAEAGPSPARCCALTQAIVPDASVTRLSYATLPLSALDVVRRGPLALLGAAAYDPAAYDMVLLESPCGNHRLDATLISGACSATVLIARAGVTTLREVQAASNAIRQAGGLLLGAVLAGAPPPPKWLQLLGVRR